MNLASILLGLVSLFLAALAVGRKGAKGTNLMVLLSFCLCLAPIVMQIAETERLILIGDISAVMDTTRARLMAAVGLSTMTAVLNAAALLRKPK